MRFTDAPSRAKVGDLVRFFSVSVAAGVVVAVAVTPLVAVAGSAAKHGLDLFEGLPGELRTTPLDQRTEVFARSHGREVLLTTFSVEDRKVVGRADVPLTVKHALLAAEDVRFYEHGGVDPVGIVRALVSNLRGDAVQGASTITQQYVKNVCVEAAAHEADERSVHAAYAACTDPSYGRKVREMRLAIGLEKHRSKDGILLDYLNIVGFGGRIYGIEAAAERYFGRPARTLGVGEAASLIAIVNDPARLRLDEPANLPANTVRRNRILDTELAQHMISRTEHDAARAEPVVPVLTSRVGCEVTGAAAYFCDYVVHVVENSPLYGASTAERRANLERGGWRIRTTLDLDLQARAQRTMRTYVPSSVDGWKVAGTGVALQVGTGRILSMVQNTDYGNTSSPGTTAVNYNTGLDAGGSEGFQPGSTFKLFTLLDWLRSGRTLRTTVDGSARTLPAGAFTKCGRRYPESWTFKNSHDEQGFSTVLHGTARSINGVFASMAQQLDLCDIRDVATRLGVRSATGGRVYTSPSFVIGQASSVTPLAMAGAYSAVANHGVHCEPVAIDRIERPDGSRLPVPTADCRRAVPRDVAASTVRALRGVLTGDGTAAADGTGDGVYEFGKTGTTDEARNTWMIGSSSAVTTAVMVANDGTAEDLNHAGLSWCPVVRSASAANTRHCLWREMQTAANEAYGGATRWSSAGP